jgi:hypothetical protein
MLEDFEYIEETLLLQNLISCINNKDTLTKNAGAISSALGLDSIKSVIQNTVQDKTKSVSPEETPKIVVDTLSSNALLPKIPVIQELATISKEDFGFDLDSTYDQILSKLKPEIEKGNKINPSTVNDAGMSVLNSLSSTASTQYSLLKPVEKLIDNYHKTAASHSPGILRRMLGTLARAKAITVIVGILVWILKYGLLAAGLLGIGYAASKLIKSPSGTQKPQGSVVNLNTINKNTVSKPSPTGAGAQVIKIAPGDLWIEYIGNRQPHEVIMQWAIDSYPILNQYQSIILRTPSFWNTVRTISQKWHQGQLNISIPDPFKKKDDVINTFIDDIFKEVNKGS